MTNGVSDDVTINGGTGDDLFDIFRNKDVLTLNGEDGDDTFVVRTFVADSELTKVTSGTGRDVIRYAMNAPVAIDGGDGYDTVIFVGTEFGDTFVVTANGVYGGGRFVSYLNIERLVIDGAEGNDRFYVQSTNANVETRIVGGLGSDRVEIAGRAPSVQADDLLGHSGIVTTSIDSVTGWKGIPIDGIVADIVDQDANAVVVVPPVGGLRVKEAGEASLAYYRMRLSKQPTSTVTVTVKAPAVNITSANRSRGVLLSLDGITWSSAVTLTFTMADFATLQKIYVKAIDDSASEDTRSVVLSTNTAGGGYDDVLVASTLVSVYDDDSVGVVDDIGPGGLQVVEPYIKGAVTSTKGSTTTYTLSLNQAPLTAVTVRIDPGPQMKVVASAGVVVQSDGTALVTFAAGSAGTVQVILEAVRDSKIEGPHYGYVTQAISSTGDVWSGRGLTAVGRQEIVVATSDLPEALRELNALRGYLVRIFDGTGAGQYRRVFESFVFNGGLHLSFDTPFDTIPGETSGWAISGYVAPPSVTGLTATVASVSGNVITLKPVGAKLPTANGGLAGAIVRVVDGSGPGQYLRIASNTYWTITTVGAFGTGVLKDGTQIAILGLHGVEIDRVAVRIADSDTPGVIVTQSDGSTRVVEGDSSEDGTDTYTVRLTQDPGQTIRVWLTPKKTRNGYEVTGSTGTTIEVNERVQVKLSGTGVECETSGRCYIDFNGMNWMDEVTVTVTAIADDGLDGDLFQSFAPVARRASAVQGPLFVIGGLDPDPAYDTSLAGYLPVLLPGEYSGPPKPPVLPTIRVYETKQVDTLVVHNEDSPADDIGTLTKTRITGLGMAPDLYVAGRLFQGGITYLDLEALQVLLGYGDDTFTVESTHDGTTLIDADPGEPTAPRQGNDRINVWTLSGHTVILGRGGDDVVRAGTDGSTGSLDNLKALLSVDGGAGYDTVYLDDHSEPDGNWASITPDLGHRAGMGAGADSVWYLRPGSASVVTIVVVGIGYLQIPVASLTADNLVSLLQALSSPAA